MILGFKTKFENGKETNFRPKILSGIFKALPGSFDKTPFASYNGQLRFSEYSVIKKVLPKLHTMREDAGDRWKAGRMIHFSTGVRTKNYCCFAPVIPVISTQQVEIREMIMTVGNCIKLKDERVFVIEVDGRRLEKGEIERLAKNDGFDGAEEFFGWFGSSWKGKIIHWTDLRY